MSRAKCLLNEWKDWQISVKIRGHSSIPTLPQFTYEFPMIHKISCIVSRYPDAIAITMTVIFLGVVWNDFLRNRNWHSIKYMPEKIERKNISLYIFLHAIEEDWKPEAE